MYERSAIVLERYIEKILEFNKNYNLKKNNENYNELIQDFDDTVKQIENLQQEQEKIYKSNKELEGNRTQLFKDLGEDAKTLENKLIKIEDALERNNDKLKEIREEFIKCLSDFSQKQKDRNKCEKARRVGEAKHVEYLQKINEEFSQIDVRDAVNLKDFISSEKEQVKQEALEIMTKNGKNERVAFNQDVLKKAINTRIDIAEKEAECYILVFDRMKKLLGEKDTETIKLNKYKKVLRDTSVKLAFLRAKKEYIVGFLDYERMTAISGTRAHKKMMVEACNNFELDMIQIKNLYQLILKEISNKSTQKAYRELYNKTYLKNIEDKEKNFEEEVNNVNISMGTVINSNYWRIEGIKNIYNVFQEEVSEKFEKDLSEYQLEESEESEEVEEFYEDDYECEYDKKFETDDDEYEDYDKYEYDDEYNDEDEENDEEEDDEDKYEEDDKDDYEDEDEEDNEFDDEESLEELIEKSRKKANSKEKQNKEDSRGLFGKLFRK